MALSASRESVMRGRALAKARPEDVWRAFSEPARMPAWFSGAKDVVASPGYPRVGGTLRWRVGRWRFEARVVECDPPRLLRQLVAAPSATSTITHRVEVADDGRVWYEKEVAAQWKGWLEQALAGRFVARSVMKEAERVARLAEGLSVPGARAL